jgi:predicted RNase H-like HicB family nuclease
MKLEVNMKFNITLEKDNSGYYVAEVPALPGCLSQGKTRREAIKNIHEAIEGWMEVMESKQKIHKSKLVSVKV